ncbi:metal-dependent hydrolase [Halostagnicola kamekurae]|uniref:LexA-binding, inner membrane-associated putative hydrolase n=1 Tax=Halostagnicola kamekurae TaxID=619731 RepID=A0A1I6UDX8_9EURY|nr:metal-dependent hydrolase [Halostagnicola kamekurae]SFS99633.1 LexA-binding, inner membrane-associated putative hydrolase [Halostagnicola kamekurae]
MWPWEHAIVGYVAYSLFCHAYYRSAPGGLEAFAVVFASVLPDLIDKPLSWQFGIFDSGYAIGHSIFFVIPVATAVGLVARSYDRTHVGAAFGVVYLLHLPSDILDRVVRGGYFVPEIAFWPVATVAGYERDIAFFEYFFHLLGGYTYELLSGSPSPYLLFQLSLGAFAALLWLYDGAPVAREFLSGLKQVLVRTAREVS